MFLLFRCLSKAESKKRIIMENPKKFITTFVPLEYESDKLSFIVTTLLKQEVEELTALACTHAASLLQVFKEINAENYTYECKHSPDMKFAQTSIIVPRSNYRDLYSCSIEKISTMFPIDLKL